MRSKPPEGTARAAAPAPGVLGYFQPRTGDADPKQYVPAPRDWSREAVLAGWLLVAAGALFRIGRWLRWRSLWLDELYVTHSIVTRGFRRLLFEPLDYWQGAPAGFLALERLCVDLFGPGDHSLRLPSLLAALAALPLFFALVRRVLPARAALIALLLFSCLSPLAYYAQEVKQYSTDVAVTLAILLTAVMAWDEPLRRGPVAWYALAGAVAIFFSHPAPFVLAGTCAVLLAARARRAKKGKTSLALAVFPLIAAAALWGPLELANIHYFLKPLMKGEAHDGLVHYWINAGGFPPRDPAGAFPWLWSSFYKIIHEPSTMYITAADLGILTAIVGAAGLILGKRPVPALLILSPLPLALVAAYFKRYPFADRLALYAAPALTLLIAAGIDRFWGDGNWLRTGLGLLVVLMIAGGSVIRCGYELRYPTGREETKPVYRWVKQNWRPGDVLLLSRCAAPSFDYYAPKVGLLGLEQIWPVSPSVEGDRNPLLEASAQGIAAAPWFAKAFGPVTAQDKAESGGGSRGYVLVQPNRSDNPAKYLDDVYDLFHPRPEWRWPPVKRVFVVFTHVWDDTGAEVDRICLPEFDRRAELMQRDLKETGCQGFLFELTDTPSAYLRQ